MRGIIITGSTGSGKTFKAIEMAKKFNKWAYVAPCRQLVYETYMKYCESTSALSTGEIFIREEMISERKSLFAVYESITDSYKDYDCIVIDEAHFLADEERGKVLSDIIKSEVPHVILCSATMSVDLRSLTKKRSWSKEELQLRQNRNKKQSKYNNPQGSWKGGIYMNKKTGKSDLMTVALFEGRHELPENEGAICSGFSFESFRAERNQLWDKALAHISAGGRLKLYVTGLTPALTEFMAIAMKSLGGFEGWVCSKRCGGLGSIPCNCQENPAREAGKCG